MVSSFTEGAALEAFAGSTPSPSATAVTRGVYTIGSLPPLLPESFADLDGNGLSDSGEQIFRQFDPAADPAGDGAHAIMEMLGGTDPGKLWQHPATVHRSGPSVLFLTAVEPPPSSLRHFGLTGKPGIRHAVQFTAELATGPWTD